MMDTTFAQGFQAHADDVATVVEKCGHARWESAKSAKLASLEASFLHASRPRESARRGEADRSSAV